MERIGFVWLEGFFLAMFYGTEVWDHWLIVAQIACQCVFYITLGVFLSMLIATRVSRMSLVYFFWLCNCNYVHHYWMVCHFFNYAQCYCRRLASVNNMVDCRWYWNCSYGFARRISMHQTWIERDSYNTLPIKCLIDKVSCNIQAGTFLEELQLLGLHRLEKPSNESHQVTCLIYSNKR